MVSYFKISKQGLQVSLGFLIVFCTGCSLGLKEQPVQTSSSAAAATILLPSPGALPDDLARLLDFEQRLMALGIEPVDGGRAVHVQIDFVRAEIVGNVLFARVKVPFADGSNQYAADSVFIYLRSGDVVIVDPTGIVENNSLTLLDENFDLQIDSGFVIARDQRTGIEYRAVLPLSATEPFLWNLTSK